VVVVLEVVVAAIGVAMELDWVEVAAGVDIAST
jgi:hypothetical protein